MGGQHICTYIKQPLEHASFNKHLLYCRKDELEHICTLVKADDLKKILDKGTWLDTNIMYYYFEILRDGCDTCFIADLSVCVSKMIVLI